MYENSESVGQAWTSTGLKREELVLTTKRESRETPITALSIRRSRAELLHVEGIA
jgi:diketogulonate reductase-like aldo/keto reductase